MLCRIILTNYIYIFLAIICAIPSFADDPQKPDLSACEQILSDQNTYMGARIEDIVTFNHRSYFRTRLTFTPNNIPENYVAIRFAQRYPDLAGIYGFAYYRLLGRFDFLTTKDRNQLLDKLRGTRFESHVKFVDVGNGHITTNIYGEHLRKGLVPLSLRDRYFYHDRMSDHIVGILLMPRIFIDAFTTRLNAMYLIKDSNNFTTGQRKIAEYHIEEMIRIWDVMTASLGMAVVSQKVDLESAFQEICSLIYGSISPFNFLLEDTGLPSRTLDMLLIQNQSSPVFTPSDFEVNVAIARLRSILGFRALRAFR